MDPYVKHIVFEALALGFASVGSRVKNLEERLNKRLILKNERIVRQSLRTHLEDSTLVGKIFILASTTCESLLLLSRRCSKVADAAAERI